MLVICYKISLFNLTVVIVELLIERFILMYVTNQSVINERTI